MRIFSVVITAGVVFMGAMCLLNLGFSWMSEANTMQAMAGFLVILIGIAIVAVLMAKTLGALHRRYPKKFAKWGFPFLILLLLTPGCTRVDPGHVGIQVNYYGTDRGVGSYPRVTGMVWYNPFSTKVFEYPTFVQTAKWTRSLTEGAPTNEEITFTNSDGMSIAADISISYHLEADRVPAFYVKFRNDDLDQFTHGFLRNLAREKFDNHGGTYPIDKIMGDNAPFLRDVRQDLQASLTPLGVFIDQFGFIGSPRPPQPVIDSINAKVHATQLAIQKQNELVQAQADAAKVVAKAEGDARAKTVWTEAEAASNRKIAESITPTLLELKRLDKWNGGLPSVMAGSGGLAGLILQNK